MQIHDNPKDVEKQQIFNFEEVKKVSFNFAIDCEPSSAGQQVFVVLLADYFWEKAVPK